MGGWLVPYALAKAYTDREIAKIVPGEGGGEPGPQGPPGINGVDGKTWYIAATTPANTLGAIGDMHLNTATYDIREKTAAATWTVRGNIKGPPGNPGSDANVTSQNITAALGFTPANSTTVGTLASLDTDDKSNLVSAINEVKQYANDGKSTIVAAIIGKGGTATSADSFPQLASAITNLSAGKKTKTETFVNISGTLTVANLGFVPSIITIRCRQMTGDIFCLASYVNESIDGGLTSGVNGHSFDIILGPVLNSLTVNNNGFVLTLPHAGSYEGVWLASE